LKRVVDPPFEQGELGERDVSLVPSISSWNKLVNKGMGSWRNHNTSRTWEEHLKHVDEILTVMEEQSLFFKEEKCEFGLT